MRPERIALFLTAMICLNAVLPVTAFPQQSSITEEEARKFATKPNANKKVSANYNDISSNEQSSNNGGGFSWSNLIGTAVQMFVGGGLDKSDSVGGMQGLIGAVLASFLGGQDKDVAALAKQAGNIIQVITSLLDALKMSFSQRSSTARSLGAKDPFSDAGVAAVTIMKGYINTHKTDDEICMQRLICEANNECSRDAPDSGYLFCQLGTYAASYLLEKSTFTPLDAFTTAGRYGRTGEDCAQIFQQCNEL